MLSLFLPKLKEKESSFSLELNNPKQLAKVIQAAYVLDEFSWIKDKFDVRVVGNTVRFTYRTVEVVNEVDEYIPETHTDDIEYSPMNFFQLAGDLVLNVPKTQRIYANATLTEEELNNLNEWAKKNGYTLEYKDDTLSVKKNA